MSYILLRSRKQLSTQASGHPFCEHVRDLEPVRYGLGLGKGLCEEGVRVRWRTAPVPNRVPLQQPSEELLGVQGLVGAVADVSELADDPIRRSHLNRGHGRICPCLCVCCHFSPNFLSLYIPQSLGSLQTCILPVFLDTIIESAILEVQ